MSESNPPLELQRFGRSQTPESPHPLHIPDPSNIPVLENQIDPVFNDTATYNIRPDSQSQQRDFHDSLLSTANPTQLSVHDEAIRDPSSTADNTLFDTGIERLFANDTAGNPPDFLQAAQPTVGTAATFAHAPPILHVNHNIALQLQPPSNSVLHAPDPFNSFARGETIPADNASPTSASDYVAPTHKIYPDETSGDVDYQTLLEQVSKSVSSAPAAAAILPNATNVSGVEASLGDQNLLAIPGLPPKPPPQDHQFPNDAYASVTQSYPSFGVNPRNSAGSNELQASLQGIPSPESLSATGANGMPPPPNAFQTPSALPLLRPPESAPGESPRAYSDADRPWSPNTQAVYDQFLGDERNYVLEGVWDRFPIGSRLFVGNLPTEKVTKRDLFHVFHKYGRLAQISIKQAYGFVQFLESDSCARALQVEQSVEIRGRKVHLEVSKPQKNTRGSGQAKRRRSRSPERGSTRERAPFSDYRDEPGRRKDDRWQPGRTPSPRGYRSRDNYRSRDRSPRPQESRENRPRSPAYANNHMSQAPAYDEEATLPLPFRSPADVPDVQLLVLEELAPQFVQFVEQSFRQKGLKAQTLALNPRLPFAAVVKRQIKEGVQAIVKLARASQYNNKIPLQVFDRVPGTTTVSFNEYVDLDVHVAADIVIHQRQKEKATQQPQMVQQFAPQQQYQGQALYGYPQTPQQPNMQFPSIQAAQYPQHMPQQAMPQYRPTSQSSVTPNPTGGDLQQLLANLRQPAATPYGSVQPQPAAGGRPTDLAGLLSNVAARQQNQSHAYSQPAAPSQHANHLNQPPQQQYGQNYAQNPANLQSIVEQLSRQAR